MTLTLWPSPITLIAFNNGQTGGNIFHKGLNLHTMIIIDYTSLTSGNTYIVIRNFSYCFLGSDHELNVANTRIIVQISNAVSQSLEHAIN